MACSTAWRRSWESESAIGEACTKPKKQIPRRLKPARNDKIKTCTAQLKLRPFENRDKNQRRPPRMEGVGVSWAAGLVRQHNHEVGSNNVSVRVLQCDCNLRGVGCRTGAQHMYGVVAGSDVEGRTVNRDAPL